MLQEQFSRDPIRQLYFCETSIVSVIWWTRKFHLCAHHIPFKCDASFTIVEFTTSTLRTRTRCSCLLLSRRCPTLTWMKRTAFGFSRLLYRSCSCKYSHLLVIICFNVFHFRSLLSFPLTNICWLWVRPN